MYLRSTLNDSNNIFVNSSITVEGDSAASQQPSLFHDDILNGTNNITAVATEDASNQHMPTTLYVISGILFFVFSCYLMKPNRSPEALRRLERYKKKKIAIPAEVRSQQIQQSLTVQRVVSVDKSGQVQLRDIDECSDDCGSNNLEEETPNALVSQSSTTSESNNSDDDLIACCCICLEPYEKDDVVAWCKNPSDTCLHVFHKDCIYQWLENPKHDDCPSCRANILLPIPNDEMDDACEIKFDSERNINNAVDNESQNSYNNRSAVFYIMHGLISRVQEAQFSLIGQTISFDSEDSSSNEININTSTGIPKQPFWRNPSPFRRALSFGDMLFPNKIKTSERRHSTGWKALDMKIHNTNRRASTKLNTAPMCLHVPHDMRRVVSAGPCTPFDKEMRCRGEQNDLVDDSQSAGFPIPFQRSWSLRRRLFQHESNQQNISDNDMPCIGSYVNQVSLRRSSISWAMDTENVDFTDATEEDDILIQKDSS